MIQQKQPKKVKGARKKRRALEKEKAITTVENMQRDFARRIDADVFLALLGGRQ